MRKRIRQCMCLMVALTAWGFAIASEAGPYRADAIYSQDEQTATRGAGGEQNSIEGCVVRRANELYLQPRTGSETRLNAGNTDLNSHIGKNVRLVGTSQMRDRASTSESGATARPGGTAAGTEPEFMVTRVDVIDEQCPVDIQKKIDEKKSTEPPR